MEEAADAGAVLRPGLRARVLVARIALRLRDQDVVDEQDVVHLRRDGGVEERPRIPRAVGLEHGAVRAGAEGPTPTRALLANRLNGEALPEAHGGPCRLVIAGGVCYASVKWVDHIRLAAERPEETALDIAAKRNREGPNPPRT